MGRARVVLGLIFLPALFAGVIDARAQTGSITGTVVDAVTLAPLFGTDDAPYRVAAYRADGLQAYSANTDALGHYAFFSMQAGTYFVKVTLAPGYVTELHDNIVCITFDCPPTAGAPVMVGAGTTTIDFAVARAGVISGTVRRISDGSGIAGLSVFIYSANASFVTSVNTGAGGSYSVGGLASGSYLAGVTSGSWSLQTLNLLGQLYGGILCPAVTCQITAATPIPVTAGATTSGIDFSLDSAGTISGTVVAAATSSPITTAFVAVYAGDVQIATGSTTGTGHYSIPGLTPGAYRVRTVQNGPYVDEWHNNVCVGCPGTPAAVVVTAGATVSGIDFALSTGGTISGSVTCEILPTSNFNAGPRISVFNSSGTFIRSVDAGCGTEPVDYAIQGLPTGLYYLLARDLPFIPFGIRSYGGVFIDKLYGDVVCNTVDCDVRRGTPVMVMSGSTTPGIHFSLKQGASSSLVSYSSGRLVIYDSRGVELVDAVRALFNQQFTGLPPGTYYAKVGEVLLGRGTCPTCPPTSGQPIIVEPGVLNVLLTGYDPAPGPGPHVAGTVRDASNLAPLSTIAVDFFTKTGQILSSTMSDFNGNYHIPDAFDQSVVIPPGTYFLATRNARGYVDEVYPDSVCVGCDVRVGTPVVVGTTDVTGIDFAISAGGVASGSVTDTSGVSVAGAIVSFFSPSGTLVGRTKQDGSDYFRATLPAGSYGARVEASPAHGAEIFKEQPCTSGACDVTAGTLIPVATGTLVSNVNFTVARCTAMTLSPPLLSSGVVGRLYRQALSTSGGVGPYTFRVSDGTLPLGLALGESTGVIEGTPTVSGRHAFTVGVVDANGCATGRAYTLDVQDCAFTLSPARATLPAAGGTVTVAIADTCGSQTVTGLTFVTVRSNTAGLVAFDVPANTAAAPRTNDLTIGRRVFTVLQAGVASQPPFGALDTPADGAQVSGSIAVGGWALDDLEVRHVQLFRDPVGGEPAAQVFLGTAVFVAGARPDVARAYPTYPLNNRAGWGFLVLTNMLPNQGNGTFRIYAYADDAEGARTLLGARTLVVSNATATLPFGAIDTPAQGETIAGSAYLNWGWALTPQPKIIPTDGSTIQVLVDGVPLGNPTYNLFRSDVSGLFLGLANSGGPVGYRTIDTTGLAEGQHTIAWIVSDSLGAATGIGSRYFSVANSADGQPPALTSPSTKAEPADGAAVQPAPSAPAIAEVAGPDSGRHAASLSGTAVPDVSVIVQRGARAVRRLQSSDEGARAVTLQALERLELSLGGAATSCAGTWAGYLIDRDRLSDLPVGAAIDPAGTFYWQPGPGFIGTFELVFVRTACDGSKERLSTTVTIGPR